MYEKIDLIAGLDIGTTKTSVIVAERDRYTGEAQIIGVGSVPSAGLRKGLIVNFEQVVRSVSYALEDAESMTGIRADSVFVCFSGALTTSITSKGMVSLGSTPRQVTEVDIQRVIEASLSEISMPNNYCTVHTIPVTYSIDGQRGIDDPLGMTGVRLEVEVQSIMSPTATVQNVVNCAERAGVSVAGLVIKPLASALGVLSPGEISSGVAVIDIGGGTTGITIYVDGALKRLTVIQIGGDHITNDIARVLKVPIEVAEELKRYVSLGEDFDAYDEELEFMVQGKRGFCSAGQVHEVAYNRLEELFDDFIKKELRDVGSILLPSGIVLTGGVAKMKGITEMVSEVLNMPVRVANPLDSAKMPPGRNGSEYASLAGIIKYMNIIEKCPFKFIGPSITLTSTISSKRGRSYGEDVHGLRAIDFFKSVLNAIKRTFKELF
ncbi:MAG TPA: cell division protein FtsA [Acetomicrobium sp.]|nr:cell division protein FtsA [Acetomicrobium sp.]